MKGKDDNSSKKVVKQHLYDLFIKETARKKKAVMKLGMSWAKKGGGSGDTRQPLHQHRRRGKFWYVVSKES